MATSQLVFYPDAVASDSLNSVVSITIMDMAWPRDNCSLFQGTEMCGCILFQSKLGLSWQIQLANFLSGPFWIENCNCQINCKVIVLTYIKILNDFLMLLVLERLWRCWSPLLNIPWQKATLKSGCPFHANHLQNTIY